MSNFKPIPQVHGHSHHSLDGAATVSDIVKRFKDLGIPAGTLTEHGNLNSAMEFFLECQKQGIQPILGIEAYVEDEWSEPEFYKTGKNAGKQKRKYTHLTIHFKTEKSYHYFTNLTVKMNENAIVTFGETKPIIKLEDLEPIAGEIVICSGCMVSSVCRNLINNKPDLAVKIYERLRNIAGPGNFFVEVFPHQVTHNWVKPEIDPISKKITKQGYFKGNECTDFAQDGDLQKSVNKFILDLANKYGDPVVPSLDFHFATPEQYQVQTARLGNGQEQWRFHQSYYISTSDEVAQNFKDLLLVNDKTVESWIDNAYLWSTNFKDFKIKTNKDRWIMAEFSGDTMKETKRIIDEVGRMRWDNPQMVDRLKEEIRVLHGNGKLDVLPYFFPMADLTKWCRQEGHIYNARGSAGGSLLAYLMGITNINPLKYDLSFERFINEGRIKANTLPDIDLDVNKDKVISYLTQKYGNRIMQLSIDVKMKIKSAIKDAERSSLGSVRKETEDLCVSIPNPDQGVDEHDYVFGYTDDDGNHRTGVFETIPALRKYAEDNPEIWETVVEMLGIIKNKSGHACGMAIADKPISEYIPLTKVSGELLTGFSPKSLEAAGLIKYDILGVNTLKDVGECLKNIKERTGQILDPFDLPDDPEVYKQFALGNTETVFQFNTVTVKPFLRSIKPKSIEELSNITSLARPGCLDADSGDNTGRTLADVYVARVNGKEETKYIHPDMEPILKNTFGTALFQEQIIRMFTDLAGYTKEEAENVRRGIGKKDEKVLREAALRLKHSCVQRGWTEAQAQTLMDQIMASSRYGFNKSHSISYSSLGYACMYLKTKFPLEWWTSVLTNASKTELPKFWSHCGPLVLLPDVNKSGEGWQIEGDKIRAPISIINGVGDSAYEQVIKAKPFTDIEDFVHKTKEAGRAVHKGVIIKMIAAGVLDSLFPVEMVVEDKIYEYLKIKARQEKKKKIEEIPEEFRDLNNFKRFMIQKDVIPVISMDLRKTALLYTDKPKDFSNGFIKDDNGRYFMDGDQLDKMAAWMMADLNAKSRLNNNIYTLSYAIEESTKSYANKTKQMTRLMLDTGGTFHEAVVWPKYGENVSETGFKNKICRVCWRLSEKDGKMSIKAIERINII